VVGKWLAAMALLCATLILTMVFAVTVAKLGPLDKGPAVAGYLGLLLMGGSYIAVGVMASSFARNQVVALIIAFGICFALFLFGKVLPFVPDVLKPVVAFLSTDTHFENIARGVIDSRDVFYYLSLIVVSLLIATTSLESRKWK
jgi:ABC-2 type transport system permease protein